MDVHIRDLRYFVAVAEELNFTKAATRVFVSQPALSKQIGQLETHLRVELFHRDRRGVTLTAEGEALLPTAKRILAEWDTAHRSLADALRQREQTLTVGFHTRIGRGLIPSVTAEMARSAPQWRLNFRQVSWADPTVGLADEGVDVAIAWLPMPDTAEFDVQVVAREDRWVALPLRHRLADQSVVPFADLADEPVVALPATAGRLRDFWLANDHRTRPAVIAAETATADEAFEAIAAGLGIALVSEGNTRIYERDDIIFRPVTGISLSELAVAWRADDRRPVLRTFVTACTQCLCRRSAEPAG